MRSLFLRLSLEQLSSKTKNLRLLNWAVCRALGDTLAVGQTLAGGGVAPKSEK
jgi:hypothetical protein